MTGHMETREKATVAAHGAPSAVEVSIVMPCLNEAETIEICVRKAASFLKDHGIRGEVIVADTGRTL